MTQDLSKEKYLSKTELDTVLKAVKTLYVRGDIKITNFRNYLLIKMMYLHGLRVSEALNLRWDNINYDNNTITIKRLKDSMTTTQLMRSDEVKELKRLERYKMSEIYIFVKPDGTKLTRQAVNLLCKRIKEKTGIEITPHCLKHTCGVHLALNGKNVKEIQYHLGHKQITNTMIYLNYSPMGDANNLF